MTFDVFGVCTTRDIFSLVENDRFKVKRYYQLSIPPAFNEGELIKGAKMELSEIIEESNFRKKCALAECNNTVLGDFESSGAEWMILDLRSIPKGVLEVKVGGETYYYSTWFTGRVNSLNSWKKRGIKVDSIRYRRFEDIPDHMKYVDLLCDFLKKRYGKNIVLVQIREAMFKIDGSGTVYYTNDRESDTFNILLDKYFNLFLEKLDCYYIKTPSNVIYDVYNSFGPRWRVHYVYEYYEYAQKALELIVQRKKNLLKELDRLYIDCTARFEEIRSYSYLSRTNTLGRIKKAVGDGATELDGMPLYEYIQARMEEATDPKYKAELEGYLGRILDKGIGVPADKEQAISWFRKSMSGGIDWAGNMLVDALWSRKTPEAYTEILAVSNALAAKGNKTAMFNLGRIYYRGRGVERDLAKAAEYMRPAAAAGVPFSKIALCDVLYETGTPEAYAEMVKTLKPLADKGSGRAALRLAVAYRDGNGVKRDLAKAAEMARLAASKNIPSAKKELAKITKMRSGKGSPTAQ